MLVSQATLTIVRRMHQGANQMVKDIIDTGVLKIEKKTLKA